MQRDVFFDRVRKKPFGGSLNAGQVEGMEALLDMWRELYPDADARFIANSLSQIHRETGGRMVPVRETFASSAAQAVARLDNAWSRGQLKWVKSPYWRTGFFGRGVIQLTHEANYRKMGLRLGVDLVANPGLALDMRISAKIAIVGMVEGSFTGRKLADYFNATTDDPAGARRIVNGPDGTDALIAAMHREFLAALKAAGYGTTPAPVIPRTYPPLSVEPAPAPSGGFWAALAKILTRIFGGKP
jgi:putative chitinase